MTNRRAFLITSLAALAAPSVLRATSTPLNVVATTSMIADAARVIGGDHVAVQALMGPGIDPHSYRQTRSDIAALTRADLVLAHGLFLEAQMEDFLERLSERQPVALVGEAVPADQLIGHEDYPDRKDPHVWMDPDLWANVIAAVAQALGEVRPEAAAQFEANTAAYLQQAQQLSDYASATLASVPPERRVLVTAHDAFRYFGAAHDFEVLGIQGISTESEAGLNRISDLVDVLVERGIGAVFVESSVSDRNVRALIEGAAAQGHEVQIGGELYSDAMGPVGSYEGTWIGMIDHNVTTIAAALGGTPPAGGMSGRLGTGL